VAPEELARLFHDTYEALAPSHGWETQERSRKDWDEVPAENKSLMIAVAARVLDALELADGGYPYMEHYRLILAMREADVIDKANRHQDDTWRLWLATRVALIDFEQTHGPSPAVTLGEDHVCTRCPRPAVVFRLRSDWDGWNEVNNPGGHWWCADHDPNRNETP
jgi:hypothetical protein